jgi:GNAT superfamily N-acetyltransferase
MHRILTDVSLVVRPAAADEVDVVLGLLRSASAARGEPQSRTWGTRFPDVERDLPKGRVWLAVLDGDPVGTFVLRFSDERVWGPDDGRAGYLHRLATRPDVAGQGLGARLLDEASKLISVRGREWLRLDCDRGNRRLRSYYEELGFQHVGDVDEVARSTRPGHRSASLYERRIVDPSRPDHPSAAPGCTSPSS